MSLIVVKYCVVSVKQKMVSRLYHVVILSTVLYKTKSVWLDSYEKIAVVIFVDTKRSANVVERPRCLHKFHLP